MPPAAGNLMVWLVHILQGDGAGNCRLSITVSPATELRGDRRVGKSRMSSGELATRWRHGKIRRLVRQPLACPAQTWR